jgi:hypothetical protein
MQMTNPFPGRRRKMAEPKHEKSESPVMEAKERREEARKRPVLKLKKRGR